MVCVVYWRYLQDAVVRLMSCNAPLGASRLKWVNAIDGSMFHWAFVRIKNHICSSCWRWTFVSISVGGWILFGSVRA